MVQHVVSLAESVVSNAQSPPKDQQVRFFMSSYLLDAICAH